MLKEPMGATTKLPHEATRERLEDGYCEIVREVHESIHQSSLDQFTLPRIDSFWNELNVVLYQVERLPETSFKELIDVVLRLREARNELRLARFLFDVEEIQPIRRFVLRNKAVLRGKRILYEVLLAWPLNVSSAAP